MLLILFLKCIIINYLAIYLVLSYESQSQSQSQSHYQYNNDLFQRNNDTIKNDDFTIEIWNITHIRFIMEPLIYNI
jgi:hypothetical protein